MCWLAMWFLTWCFSRHATQGDLSPKGYDCSMKPDHQNLWWINTMDTPGQKSCETFVGHESNQDCGACLKNEGWTKSVCNHFKLLWKYNYYITSGTQHCIRMDNCKESYFVTLVKLAKICGFSENNKTGNCINAYGTYICECYDQTYQGRDCTDVGPKGAYASGVQVMLSDKVRVSEKLTILVAVRSKGSNFKVNVHLPFDESVIQITEPIETDPSSTRLIKLCEDFTIINKDCKAFLEGSTTMYGIDLRFPVKRDENIVMKYEDPTSKINYPYGYWVGLEITTTNLVNNIEKISFFRMHDDYKYYVWVEYPIDINCYKNVKIDSCKELKKKVNVYHASEEITLTAKIVKTSFDDLGRPDSEKPGCETSGDKTTKWKISQIMPNGTFSLIYDTQGDNKFTFTIPAYKFKNGLFHLDFTYKMITQGEERSEARENFDECYVTVVEEPLVAIIDGGSSIYVNIESTLSLDGRRSYDPSLPGNAGKIGLKFKWTCTTDQGTKTCLDKPLSHFGTNDSFIKLNPPILEYKKEYTITLEVKKDDKAPAYAKQVIIAGKEETKIVRLDLKCINCFDGNIANPTDYIYLEVYPHLKKKTDVSLNFNWTYSSLPDLPPSSTDSISVHTNVKKRLKISGNKLEQNKTYEFCVFVDNKDPIVQACIIIHTGLIENFTCTFTPEHGIEAKTVFSINCSQFAGVTVYEVYDKSLKDPNYFSGRMLFTGLDVSDNYFKLANEKLVVYGYNKFKMIQEWNQEVKLSPFDGQASEVDKMLQEVNNLTGYPQTLLHSASIVPVVVKYKIIMDWSSILQTLISAVYNVKLEALMYTKLVLSSIEYIFATYKKEVNLTLQVEEAKMSAEIISDVACKLFERVKYFDKEATLTDKILHQMDRSILNVIETVLTLKNAQVFAKPLYLLNPKVLRTVKETSYHVVDALYVMGKIILWRQLPGESVIEIVSAESKISQWALVKCPEELYSLRRQNQDVRFSFSSGFYKIIKNMDTLGIQITNLTLNPYWWAGGDISTDILLVQLCFKVGPTECKDKRLIFKAPIFLYYNITEKVKSLRSLQLHTVYLNFTKNSQDLDLDVTVYRFDPPARAKLFYKFDFESHMDDFRFLFKINMRPDFKTVMTEGITINAGNQSSLFSFPYEKKQNDKLYYLGIIPLQEGREGEKLNFKLSIFYVVCKTWLKWKWGRERCWVGEEETNERTLRCDCSHLSMFAGTVKVPTHILNPAMEFLLFLTEVFNWLPLVVLVIIILVFILLFIWGWFRDRKDGKKGIVTILEDNYPGERFGYLLGVFTGSRINAGTDSHVGIKLFGDNDESRAHILKSSDQPILRANSDDWFLLYCPEHLGTLERLQVWHDNSGKSPDWFVEKIEVYDLTDQFKYIFELNIWLALEVNEYPDAVVATSSMTYLYSVRRVLVDNFVTGLRDTHYWTSVLWKHPRNPIKRVYRLSVLFFYIMVAMSLTIIFYRFNKGEYKEDEPTYSITYPDLIIFVLTLFVASFLSCLVMFLFRKSFFHRYFRQQSSVYFRPDDMNARMKSFSKNKEDNFTDHNYFRTFTSLSKVSLYESTTPKYIELSNANVDERFIRAGLKRKLRRERSTYESFASALHGNVRGSCLEPVRLPQYRKSMVLHRVYFLIAWILFVVIVLISIVIVSLFGHEIPIVYSKKWITVFLCVILFEAFVLSMLKILLFSIILACAFQTIVPESSYQLNVKDGMQNNLTGNMDHLHKLLKIRSHPMYCPLNEKIKDQFRIKRIRSKMWKTLLDFMVVILLILVLAMLTSVFTVNIYGSNAHASWMLTQGQFLKYPIFTNVYNRTHYTEFITQNFLEQLYRYLWYNMEVPLNDANHTRMRRNSWTYDCTMRLLGSARIRQLRVILGECSKINYFEHMNEHCSPPWSSRVEDTGTYGSNWDLGSYEDINRKMTAWKYTDASLSNSSATDGPTHTLYPAGGYIEDIGYEQDQTAYVLSLLFPLQWLDHMTRAVFVELTLYNVNTDLFSQVILIAEQMPTGEYLVAVKAESVTTELSFNAWNVSFAVFLIFFLSRMCVLMNRIGIFVYFSKILNVFEVFLLALGFLTLIFYIIHVTTSSEYVQEFQRSGFDEFFSFSAIIYYSYSSRIALCMLFVCVIIRLLISWKFGRIYLTFYYTFLMSLPWIFWLILYLSIFLIILWRFIGYMLNIFILTYVTTVIIYYTDFIPSEDESFHVKFLGYTLCLLSYLIILLFIASFTYYYKVAKVHRLVSSDMYNIFTFVKETVHLKIDKLNIKKKFY